MSLLKGLTRAFAVTGKEVLVVLRRPTALATLVVGPVLILAVFGLSFTGQPPIRAVLVVPAGSGLPAEPSAYGLDQPGVLQVVGIETSLDAAHRDLHQGKADIVVSAPSDAAAQLKAGKQVGVTVEYDTVNPYQEALIGRGSQPLAARLNSKLIGLALTQGAPGSSAAPDAQALTSPTTVQTRDLAPTTPRLVSFYGVAVLALIVQHLGLTLAALSTTGDRRQGLFTVLRTAPVSAFELLVGKYMAFVALTGGVTVLLVLLLTRVLAVPLLAPTPPVLAMFVLLVLASVGLGLVISLLTRTESHVIQLALLVLIASVFFGGLAIDLSQFARPMQAAAELLPVTQATHLGQDLFLRGATGQGWRFGALAAMAVVLGVVGWGLLRRELLLAR